MHPGAAFADRRADRLRCELQTRLIVRPLRNTEQVLANAAINEIAKVIGRRLSILVVSKSPEEATEYFGWVAMFAGFDVSISIERTGALVCWKPEQPGPLTDLDHRA